MEAHDEADGRLVLTYDSTGFTRFLLVVTAILLATAVYDYFIGARGSDRLIGLIAGAATTALASLAFYEQAHVVVNPSTRTITWSRRWGFTSKSGSLPFADIKTMLLERPIGDEGVPSRRVVLCTKGGESIPLTVGYRPDGDGAISRASERIEAMLGHSHEGASARTVQAFVDSGRLIDAIKHLRETEGLSLEEAKRRVDAIARSRT